MANSDRWIVHKFGGSSVADADCFARVASLLEALPPGRLAVVLSACRGVTDALLGLISLAEQQDEAFREALASLRERHAQIAEQLLGAQSAQQYLARFDRDCQDLEGILRTVKLTRSCGARGERSHRRLRRALVDAALLSVFQGARRTARRGAMGRCAARAARWSGARSGRRCSGRVRTSACADIVPADFAGTLIITGFIASKARGVQTTLGRNGSDFSASIFGSLLDAREIHIWTDVDGVLSADPRRVPDAHGHRLALL